MSWREHPVLVTGATGMVGSWLCRRLVAAGATVVALVRDADPQSELFRNGTIAALRTVNGDLDDAAAVTRAVTDNEVRTIFHLGAQTIVGAAQRAPLATFRSNVLGTCHVLDAARVAGSVEAVVVASSDKAYGDQMELPYHEGMPLQGRNPYDASKSCTDLVAQSYYASYGLPVGISRAGNIYGGGDLNWSRIVPGTIRSIVRGQQPRIRSDGSFRRDYLFVEDAVDAYLLLAEGLRSGQSHGEAYNFGPARPMTVLEMYDAVCSAMGVPGLEPYVAGEARGEIRDQYLDSRKAREHLGWSPAVGLEGGLARTAGWYRDFLDDSSDTERSAARAG